MVSSLLKGIYREVVEPERLVCTQFWDEYPDQEMPNTDTFAEHDGKTRPATRARFAALADRDAGLEMVLAQGRAESLARVRELVAKWWVDAAGAKNFTRIDGDR